MRYMCLSCGQFFEGESRTFGVDKCPYCKDAYYVDNCLPDIPPSIDDLRVWQLTRLEELKI